MEANGINYYKGVLLCSRPNESPSTTLKKEFCGRVHPHEQLGLVPVKPFDERKTRKRVLPVLNNHKKWLQKFKQEVHDSKDQEERERQKAAKRLERIKQEGKEQRERATQLQSTAKPAEITPPPPQVQPVVAASAHKKKEKPAWAKTAAEVQQAGEQEVDELLDFFGSGEVGDLKDYISDNEVKNILVELRNKVEKIKQQENWKQQRQQMIEREREERQKDAKEEKDDILSRISKQSGGQSVASQRTAERVEELQRKKKQTEWDKLTTSDKKTGASVDAQIAKNIADEVLRNYPALKHHSNQSIRQLLERTAHEQIKS